MKAMILREVTNLEKNTSPLEFVDIPVPEPDDDEIRIKVTRCGVCHTELDEIEGRTPPSMLPIVLGHQVVGTVDKAGKASHRFGTGERVGVAWIYSACGKCSYCRSGRENLCDEFRATGRDAHGGYAEYMTVSEDFVYPIPQALSDTEAAPLLCAGAIGYRSLRLANIHDGDNIGLVGFGASAHLVLGIIRRKFPNTKVFVFTRTETQREFARELGSFWAGDTGEEAPERLRAIIDTTPAWGPVVESMKNLEKGGRLVINAIRKEDGDKEALLGLDYARDLWMEKEIKSVANITRRDVEEFLLFAAESSLSPVVKEYALEDANAALRDLKGRTIRGAKVLRMG